MAAFERPRPAARPVRPREAGGCNDMAPRPRELDVDSAHRSAFHARRLAMIWLTAISGAGAALRLVLTGPPRMDSTVELAAAGWPPARLRAASVSATPLIAGVIVAAGSLLAGFRTGAMAAVAVSLWVPVAAAPLLRRVVLSGFRTRRDAALLEWLRRIRLFVAAGRPSTTPRSKRPSGWRRRLRARRHQHQPGPRVGTRPSRRCVGALRRVCGRDAGRHPGCGRAGRSGGHRPDRPAHSPGREGPRGPAPGPHRGPGPLGGRHRHPHCGHRQRGRGDRAAGQHPDRRVSPAPRPFPTVTQTSRRRQAHGLTRRQDHHARRHHRHHRGGGGVHLAGGGNNTPDPTADPAPTRPRSSTRTCARPSAAPGPRPPTSARRRPGAIRAAEFYATHRRWTPPSRRCAPPR